MVWPIYVIYYIIKIRQRGCLFIRHCFSVTTHCLLPTCDIKLVHGGLFFMNAQRNAFKWCVLAT